MGKEDIDMFSAQITKLSHRLVNDKLSVKLLKEEKEEIQRMYVENMKELNERLYELEISVAETQGKITAFKSLVLGSKN